MKTPRVRGWLFCVLWGVGFLSACAQDGKPSADSEPEITASVDDGTAVSTKTSYGGSTDTAEFIGLAGSEPYYKNTPYREALILCVTMPAPEHSCTLGTLPFIAQQSRQPDAEDILQRLVVSHRWMGERFAQLLTQLPQDILQLFQAVTAVVIAEDVRPSNFATTTGAIYIDPQLLWQTAEEKQVFEYFARSAQTVSLSTPLAFRSWSRYVDEQRGLSFAVSNTGNLWDESERSLSDTLLPLAALLFHELAHANDFFPPEQLVSARLDQTAYQLAGQLRGSRPSDALYRNAPLYAPQLTHLAEVVYLRQGMFSAADLQLSAAEIGAEFDLHAANDDYAFAHQFEDTAMLFEEVMMNYHFGLSRDVAYLNVPAAGSEGDCDDFVVAWGMRNRVARPEISERAQLVTERILPKPDWGAYFSSLAAPEYLPNYTGWCESVSM